MIVTDRRLLALTNGPGWIRVFFSQNPNVAAADERTKSCPSVIIGWVRLVSVGSVCSVVFQPFQVSSSVNTHSSLALNGRSSRENRRKMFSQT